MTADVVSPVLQWLNSHPHMAGLATFLVSACESIAIIGTIIPGSITMTAVGTLAGAGIVPLWTTLLWAILGALIGDNFSYWVGHHFKSRLPQLWPFRNYPQLLHNGEKFIKQHGALSVFIGRFIGPVRALVPIVAGMLNMTPLRYITISVVASILWAPLYMLPGIIIGKATLELPPDVAMHAIMTCLFLGFFALFCLWILYRIFHLIHRQINHLLNQIWERLKRSRFFHIFTILLKHHDTKKTHGQLALTFYFLIACFAFMYLSMYILANGAENSLVNKTLFHLLRSLRDMTLDSVMIVITLLGDRKTLVPVIGILFAYFTWTKRWRVALHLAGLFLLTVSGVLFFKNFIHSMRPWGVMNNSEAFSFPSGHMTIATSFYIGLSLLIGTTLQEKPRHLLYFCTTLLLASIGISRLYLGAHWFTDVIGGVLLSAIVLMLTALSYNRKKENPIPVKHVCALVFVSFACSFSFQYFRHYDQIKLDYTRAEWPSTQLSLESWWNQKNVTSPLYRIGRLGLTAEAFNLQWLGNLDDIKATLLAQGWEMPRPTDWITILDRISDISSEEHIPLVAPLYLDKKPALVLTKKIGTDKHLMILRLWNSNIIIKNDPTPLWVGSVDAIPRTYSWIIHYKNSNNIQLTPELLFTNSPSGFEVKQEHIKVHVKRKHRWQNRSLILIKPNHTP